jgi:hypothetical protein
MRDVMKKPLPPGIGVVAICLLVLVGCDDGTQATKKDASSDARDGAAERAGTNADVVPAAERGPDDTLPPANQDARDLPQAAAETSGAADAPADAPTTTKDTGEVGQLLPDVALETAPEAPADGQTDVATSLPDGAPLGPDGPNEDGPPPAADLPPPDAPEPDANPGSFRIVAVPNRALDLVFMIDNSPSMAPKQAKLKAQFPKLLDALKDPSDGTLPDLRLAVINSDLGTGGAYSSGSCGPKTLPDLADNPFGDLGRFQMIDAVGCGVTDPSALWLEHRSGRPLNYTGDIGDVFGCLATNMGTLGCGEEHSLQAFEFALAAAGIGNEGQQAMLRPNAYLGLVFLTDEEDCSAATNDGMFGDKPELRNESASLRCSTRSHACGNVNLTSEPPGYPTTQSLAVPLALCAARTDACPNPTDGTGGSTDTSVPTTCSPLKDVQRLADEMKALKSRPDEQILVAGIFGWPMSDADLATATYKIAQIPNPNTADTAHPLVFDIWPVCYDPNHLPASIDGGTGFDTTAAGWGAYPGLRLSAFVDQFGDNGMKFSICQPDFSTAMSKIGATLAKQSPNLCVAARADNYADCTASYLMPDGNGNLVRDPVVIPKCNVLQTVKPCFELGADPSGCPGSGYEVRVVSALGPGVDGGGSSTRPPGTLLEFTCE